MPEVRKVGVGHYRRRQLADKRQTVASTAGQASKSTRLNRNFTNEYFGRRDSVECRANACYEIGLDEIGQEESDRQIIPA